MRPPSIALGDAAPPSSRLPVVSAPPPARGTGIFLDEDDVDRALAALDPVSGPETASAAPPGPSRWAIGSSIAPLILSRSAAPLAAPARTSFRWAVAASLVAAVAVVAVGIARFGRTGPAVDSSALAPEPASTLASTPKVETRSAASSVVVFGEDEAVSIDAPAARPITVQRAAPPAAGPSHAAASVRTPEASLPKSNAQGPSSARPRPLTPAEELAEAQLRAAAR